MVRTFVTAPKTAEIAKSPPIYLLIIYALGSHIIDYAGSRTSRSRNDNTTYAARCDCKVGANTRESSCCSAKRRCGKDLFQLLRIVGITVQPGGYATGNCSGDCSRDCTNEFSFQIHILRRIILTVREQTVTGYRPACS